MTQRSVILPAILWNPELTTLDGKRLPTPDGWIDDVGVALQVDSAEYHSSEDGWSRTLDRHNELAKYDVQVLHITPAEFRAMPRKVLATIEQTYRARLALRVRARVVATPASSDLDSKSGMTPS